MNLPSSSRQPHIPDTAPASHAGHTRRRGSAPPPRWRFGDLGRQLATKQRARGRTPARPATAEAETWDARTGKHTWTTVPLRPTTHARSRSGPVGPTTGDRDRHKPRTNFRHPSRSAHNAQVPTHSTSDNTARQVKRPRVTELSSWLRLHHIPGTVQAWLAGRSRIGCRDLDVVDRQRAIGTAQTASPLRPKQSASPAAYLRQSKRCCRIGFDSPTECTRRSNSSRTSAASATLRRSSMFGVKIQPECTQPSSSKVVTNPGEPAGGPGAAQSAKEADHRCKGSPNRRRSLQRRARSRPRKGPATCLPAG